MTGPGVQFRTDSEVIHYEHQALSSELAALEFALDSLIGCSEVFTNFASTERVYRCTRHLAHSLPEHFQNEENTILAEVAGLKARGVVFEEYDMPSIKTVNCIATAGGAKTAWFKDTEGNTLAVSQRIKKN